MDEVPGKSLGKWAFCFSVAGFLLGPAIWGSGLYFASISNAPGEFGGLGIFAASLLIGALAVFISALVGIVLGIWAWRLAKSANRGNGMALAAIVMGGFQISPVAFYLINLLVALR